MSKRKLVQGKKPQSDSSQSSILSFFQRRDEPPTKSLKVEQEERLLAQDPISSFSQSQTSIQEGIVQNLGFFNTQTSFENDHADFFHTNPEDTFLSTQDTGPFLFDIKGFNSQQTNAESVISEFPSEPEINSVVESPRFEYNHASSQVSLKVPAVEDLLDTSLRPMKSMNVKPGGLANRALEYISQEKLDFDKWEMMIHGQMAKYGSIVKVCQKQPEVYLFRMINTWAEGNLVFSWCVLLKDEEIQYLLSNDTEEPNTQTDSIQDFYSQKIPTLPDYIPQEDDEKMLFAFSFCFTSTRVSLQNFIENEQVVGIWPDWSEVNMELDGHGPCEVNLARRFKANSIY